MFWPSERRKTEVASFEVFLSLRVFNAISIPLMILVDPSATKPLI